MIICAVVYISVTSVMLLLARYYEAQCEHIDCVSINNREAVLFTLVAFSSIGHSIIKYTITGKMHYIYYAIYMVILYIATTAVAMYIYRYASAKKALLISKYLIYVIALSFVPFIARAACPG